MTVNALMNEAQLKEWTLRRLGAPLLKVELTDAHLEDCFNDASRWFSAKKGAKKQIIFPLQSNTNEFTLPDEVDTVLDVAFAASAMDLSMIFSHYILQGDKVPYDVFAAPQSVGLYSTYVQTIQYVEMAKRILGAEQDWRQEGRKLFVFPVPKNELKALIVYKSNVFTVDQLNELDHDLVKRYMLALAKRDLGEIRTKYDSYATAQGSVQLNGSQLLAEAKEEMAALDELIISTGGPMGLMSG